MVKTMANRLILFLVFRLDLLKFLSLLVHCGLELFGYVRSAADKNQRCEQG